MWLGAYRPQGQDPLVDDERRGALGADLHAIDVAQLQQRHLPLPHRRANLHTPIPHPRGAPRECQRAADTA